MKNLLLLTCLLILLISSAFAQGEGKIKGSVSVNEVIPATISLLRARDSAVVKLAAADKEGNFVFENLKYSQYLVQATVVGYIKSYSLLIDITPQQREFQIPVIILQPVTKELTGVTVTSKKPLIDQRIDRTVVNVEASITNIGSSALEVLEKSPGVTVDREGNISLKGKEGVLVLVDGRPTQLSGADLANLLRNMSSSQLDQIEIMTTPPARYDAAGTSGIINIKTKKTITAGYNGTANLGITQGRYPKTNEGLNFNYRKNKVNLFTNVSHNYRKTFGILAFQRNLFEGNANTLKNYFDQYADRISQSNSYNVKAGLDFFATKKTTFGFVLNGSSSPSKSSNESVTNIYNSFKELESVTLATVDNTSKWRSFSTNLNFRTLLGNKGKELTSDIDFLSYVSDNDQFMANAYFDAAGNATIKTDTLQGDLPQDIKIYSGRLDYLHPLKGGARFEAGVKSSLVKTDNNANYDSIQYGRIVHDFNRSNHFLYEENINAAYVNLSTPLSKKWSAQLGLRLENTNIKGFQLTTGETFRRHYTQLFPTAYFQYKLSDKHNLAVNFGRRVRRPNYGSLNPFIRFIDRYTYSRGNPNLNPSLSNNIELSYSWKNVIITTVNYTATTDIIDEIIEQKGQEAYKGPANIASLRQFGLSVSANNPITKWWTSSINVNTFHNNYKGVVSGAAVNLAATSFMFYTTQQFKVNKNLTAEIDGRFRNGWLVGVMRVKAIGFVNAGFSRQVMQGKGTLRFTVRDIFYTQRSRGGSRYGNIDFRITDINESRVASIGFTYRFSKGKKIAPTTRTAGSVGEEKERIGQ